jgi:acetyl esterase/lipase
MTMRLATLVKVGLVCSLMTAFTYAQKAPVPEQDPSTRQVLPIWPGKPPGLENPTEHESSMVPPTNPGVHIARNVTLPTLTVYLPKSGNPSKTAVIVAPGGGFRVLAIDQEGYSVADWLSQHGIAAFVLKYRLAQTPASDEEFMPSKPAAGAPARMMTPLPEGAEHDAIADGIQAIKVVRANAAKWGISPDRVLVVGFSAGAVVTSGTMLAENPADRPNYVATIYGAPFGALPEIPADTPPAFLAVAEDDPVAAKPVLAFFNALREAKARPELHVFRDGQHGFSMAQRNSTSDHWIEELYWWMESYGLTKP